MHRFLPLLILLLTSLAGCASSPKVEDMSTLEKFNRASWALNYDILDKNIVRPAAIAFEKAPEPARAGLSNFLSNLSEPLYFVNNALQGKPKESATTVLRFVINSTFGLMGILDVAGEMGMKQSAETFSQTLGSYGIDNGPFLMLPVLGPSTVRNSVGDILDFFVYPLSALNSPQVAGKFVLEGLEKRIDLMPYEQMIDDAYDPYVFVKSTYLQNDAYKVSDGDVEEAISEEDFSDYEELLDTLDETNRD